MTMFAIYELIKIRLTKKQTFMKNYSDFFYNNYKFFRDYINDISESNIKLQKTLAEQELDN